MKKIDLLELEKIEAGVKNKNCAVAGMIATVALFAGPGGALASIGIFAGMALADCDLN